MRSNALESRIDPFVSLAVALFVCSCLLLLGCPRKAGTEWEWYCLGRKLANGAQLRHDEGRFVISWAKMSIETAKRLRQLADSGRVFMSMTFRVDGVDRP